MAVSGITKEWIEDLRSRNDIVTTISRYLPLKRSGRIYWGLCPFHHEKTPSFSVDEARQFYHCFGCGEGGDVFKFIQKIENVDFIGSVTLLAAYSGVEVPSAAVSKEESALKEKVDKMYAINVMAARRYHENLNNSEGETALKYLESRGISLQMVTKFGIGISIDYRDIVSHLMRNGADLKIAREGGLLGYREEGEYRAEDKRYYDLLGTRLIFPIQNSFGNIVGFGGRLLEKVEDKAKYKNTVNSFVFDKSKNIYGINLIKKLRLKKKVDTLILCEGYVDVISLHQAGFDTAVASMGTALTVAQCKILARFSKTVIISYDGDSAGQNATMRGLELLIAEGLEVKVLSLPDNLDPDDLIKQRGADAYKACIEAALPYFEFKLYTISKEFDLNVFDGRTRFATAAVKEIRKLPNHLEQEQYLTQVQRMSGFSLDSLQRQLLSEVTSDGVKTTFVEPTVTKLFSAVEKAARFLLYAVVNRFDFVDGKDNLLPLFESEEHRSIYMLFKGDESMTVATAYNVLPEALHAEFAAIADDHQSVEEELQENYYQGCLMRLRKAKMESELDKLSKQYDNDLVTEKQELMQQILTLRSELKKFK